MTPDERAAANVRAALELSELAEGMFLERMRREHPGASEAELRALVAQWFRQRPGAEQGDAV